MCCFHCSPVMDGTASHLGCKQSHTLVTTHFCCNMLAIWNHFTASDKYTRFALKQEMQIWNVS